jgi:hypothetical protein
LDGLLEVVGVVAGPSQLGAVGFGAQAKPQQLAQARLLVGAL